MEDFSAQSGFGYGHNDLEAVVINRYPVVREHLEWLRQHGNARMTGSGGCVFAAFDEREGAEAVIAKLPEGMKGFTAKGIAQHPLRSQQS